MKSVLSVPHSFNVTVNPGAAVPLTVNKTPVEILIAVATIANAGIIYIGGQECNAFSGIELDGGRGILFAATTAFGYQEYLQAAMGTGLNLRTFGAPSPESVPALIPMNQIFVTASAPGQTLRCVFMLPVKV